MIEILFENTQLRLYEEGKIERFHKVLKKWVEAGWLNHGYIYIYPDTTIIKNYTDEQLTIITASVNSTITDMLDITNMIKHSDNDCDININNIYKWFKNYNCE